MGFREVLKLCFEIKFHVYTWFEYQFRSLVSCISRTLGFTILTLYRHVNKHDHLSRIIWSKSSIDRFMKRHDPYG